MLNNAISSFEDGNYTSSMTVLQRLVTNAAASKKEKLKAYKYLAFIHCISAREKMCRESFEKAFALDPNFSLTPAEAGHPVWGPVFSSVKYKSVK
jgi:predicted transcriptional regulator